MFAPSATSTRCTTIDLRPHCNTSLEVFEVRAIRLCDRTGTYPHTLTRQTSLRVCELCKKFTLAPDGAACGVTSRRALLARLAASHVRAGRRLVQRGGVLW